MQLQHSQLQMLLFLATKNQEAQDIKIKAQQDEIQVLKGAIQEIQARFGSLTPLAASIPNADTGSSGNPWHKALAVQRWQDEDHGSSLNERLKDFEGMSQGLSFHCGASSAKLGGSADNTVDQTSYVKTDVVASSAAVPAEMQEAQLFEAKPCKHKDDTFGNEPMLAPILRDEQQSETSVLTDLSRLAAMRAEPVKRQFKAEEVMKRLPTLGGSGKNLHEWINLVMDDRANPEDMLTLRKKLKQHFGFCIDGSKHEVCAYLRLLNQDANAAKHQRHPKAAPPHPQLSSAEAASQSVPPGLACDIAVSDIVIPEASSGDDELEWPSEEGVQMKIADLLKLDPRTAERLCVRFVDLEKEQGVEEFQNMVETQAGIILPTEPQKNGAGALVGCQTGQDVQKVMIAFPDSVTHWKVMWPGKKALLKVLNDPHKKERISMLIVKLNNVKGMSEEDVQQEIEQKAPIKLPVKPHIPSERGFAIVGCKEKADTLALYEYFPTRVMPWVPR